MTHVKPHSLAGRNCLHVFVVAVAAAVLLGADGARAETEELADELIVTESDDHVVCVNSQNGTSIKERLGASETVRWSGAKGQVGVALTSERLLAISVINNQWQHTRVREGSGPFPKPQLGGRVAMAPTNERILGFIGPSGHLVERRLEAGERVEACRAGQDVAAAVTSQRALGLSAYSGDFVEFQLDLGEKVTAINAVADSVTVQTDQRLLIFHTRSGAWEEQGD